MRRKIPPRPIEPALLTIEEAAVYLRMKVETLRHKIYRSREIASVSLAPKGKSGVRRLRRRDLDDYIERGLVPALRVEPGRVRRIS